MRNELCSDSFHAVLAWSCGRAKCQCCTATVTVVVYRAQNHVRALAGEKHATYSLRTRTAFWPHKRKEKEQAYVGTRNLVVEFWLSYNRQPETVFVPQMFVPENGRYGNALAVSFFRRRARLRSRAHDFHCSFEKRCGKLGRYVSFTEFHALYIAIVNKNGKTGDQLTLF